VKEKICKLTSVRNFGNKKIFSVDWSFPALKPGQFFLVSNPNCDSKIIPVYIFSLDQDVYFSYPFDVRWEIGDLLQFHGPVGHGFNDLSKYSNIFMLSLNPEHHSLNSLIEIGIKENKNIAYYGQNKNIPIPPTVEIISADMIEETIEWATYIAIEINREDLPINYALLKKIREHVVTCELLIYCPILCLGKSDCMICSLKTKHGWIKTCQQGQIYNLDNLELE